MIRSHNVECRTMGSTSPDLNAVKNNSMDHCVLHSTCFPFAAIFQSNLLIHSRKTASKLSALILPRVSRTPERNSSADPNCFPWRRFLRCPNKRIRESQKRFSRRVKWISCNLQEIVIAKPSCNICCMWSWIVRMHDQPPFPSLSTPCNDLGENISEIWRLGYSRRSWTSLLLARHQEIGIQGGSRRTYHWFRTLNCVLIPIEVSSPSGNHIIS
jgi:hypothetical protein